MIDTDKYEKHTCAPWEWGKEEWSKNALITGKTSLGVTSPHNPTRADALLIADAPLLLAEVKRLRGRLRDAEDMLENCGYCRECYWDKESISDVVGDMEDEEITKSVWPDGYNKLCESCTEDFKEMIE